MVPPSKRASGEGEGTNPQKRSKNKRKERATQGENRGIEQDI